MRHRLATLATCNLDQWALDFQGNLSRIQASIVSAKRLGARYRVGPELEVPGYGCEDHFIETDTVEHSWEVIAELLKAETTHGIVCDIGMPVIHRGVRYNCRIFILDSRLLLIRPKMHLADDGNYRETRYFSTWKRRRQVEEHFLPDEIRLASQGQQASVPFGDAVLAFEDSVLGVETCEELFTPAAPHIDLALSGVEIISNSSGSHHQVLQRMILEIATTEGADIDWVLQLRKLHQRLDLMRSATAKAGGVYLYANQQGCDGGRLYYDGCACICLNGNLIAQGRQFSVREVEVVTATVDIDEVVSYRGAISSLQEQASNHQPIPHITVPFRLCHATSHLQLPSSPIEPKYHTPEEEIALGPACWLWDYLRRSGASGFLLPLSGGADSASVAAIVGSMCQQVVQAIKEGDEDVEADARRVAQWGPSAPVTDARQLAQAILTTVYMGTVNSSQATRRRAAHLAQDVGADHLDVNLDTVVDAMAHLFVAITGKTPRFKSDGGSNAENLALQNIQARVRMVLAYMLAQLMPWIRGRRGFLLVLGTANVDEGLRGYLTKYDCSSADLNPIGAISKQDLRRFLRWAAVHLGYTSLGDVEAAPPSAELEPIREGVAAQTDEQDMGMTYEELGTYGRLRKLSRCGPVSMFRHLLVLWQDRYTTEQISRRVKMFFTYYSINRHKATTLTPAYHAESYSPDDNRYDHRQFLYNVKWPWQFKAIDSIVSRMEPSAPPDAK